MPTQKLNILILIPFFRGGGGGKALLFSAREFDKIMRSQLHSLIWKSKMFRDLQPIKLNKSIRMETRGPLGPESLN